jgi:hypothetical protein
MAVEKRSEYIVILKGFSRTTEKINGEAWLNSSNRGGAGDILRWTYMLCDVAVSLLPFPHLIRRDKGRRVLTK